MVKFATREMIDTLRDETNMDDNEIAKCLGITKVDLIKLLKGQKKSIRVNSSSTCL